MAIEHFLSLLQQSSGRGSRSTALHALGLPTTAIAIILVAAFKYYPVIWLVICCVALLGSVLAVYLGSFVYLIFNNIDATRSERFYLEKLAIQQSRIGDDERGFAESRPAGLLTPVDQTPVLSIEGKVGPQ